MEEQKVIKVEEAEKILERLAATENKYKNNVTNVPLSDLNGKYKKAFDKLKQQMKDEINEYFFAFCFNGINIKKDDGEKVIEKINAAFQEGNFGQRVYSAAFHNYDVSEIKQLAEAYKERIQKIYDEYFDKHTCLYVTEECFSEENMQNPMIYNDLIDKFYDEKNNTWVEKEKPEGDAILIFVKGDKKEQDCNQKTEGSNDIWQEE